MQTTNLITKKSRFASKLKKITKYKKLSLDAVQYKVCTAIGDVQTSGYSSACRRRLTCLVLKGMSYKDTVQKVQMQPVPFHVGSGKGNMKQAYEGSKRPLPVEKTRQTIVVPLMIPSASIKKKKNPSRNHQRSLFQTCFFLNSTVFSSLARLQWRRVVATSVGQKRQKKGEIVV